MSSRQHISLYPLISLGSVGKGHLQPSSVVVSELFPNKRPIADDECEYAAPYTGDDQSYREDSKSCAGQYKHRGAGDNNR